MSCGRSRSERGRCPRPSSAGGRAGRGAPPLSGRSAGMLEFWARHRRYVRLLLVLLASFGLLAFQRSRPEGQWLAEGVATVTAPIQTAFARVHRGALSSWATYAEWKGLRT